MRTLPLLLLLAAAPARAYDLVEPLAPVLSKELQRPVAVAASADRIYVLDEKRSALLVFDASGAFLKAVGRPGAAPGMFSGPRGLAVGPEGQVFVADTGNSRVQVFDADGTPLAAFGSKGSAPGKLSKPRSVAVGMDGRVFVADTGNNRIQAFTQEGVFLFAFGSSGKEPGRFKGPTRVALDAADFVYVLDSGNQRIQKFDARAKFVKELSLLGQDFDVDEYGFIYMLDGKRGKVSEMGPDGMILGAFGTHGSGPGQLKKAQGIGLGADGAVLLADSGNGRVQRVRLENKLKTVRVPQNAATKLTLAGPRRVVRLQASAVAAGGDRLYAYLPKAGQFAVLGLDGAELGRFGTRTGKDPSATEDARALAFSRKHGLYVADGGGDKVQVFDASGKFKLNFGDSKGMFASKKKEGRVKAPSGLAVNEKGTIYVANTGNRRVDAFSPEGNYLFGVGPKVGTYELEEPVGVAFDDAGVLFVLDRGLKKVFKLEPSGGFLSAWGEEGEAVGQFQDPVAIAYDGKGFVYILDKEMPRISVFDRHGKWVSDFFARGADERSLEEPTALAVAGDQLAVADPKAQRISLFRIHPRLAPPAELSTRTVEGYVHLEWEAAGDPWVQAYRVFRASQPAGPYLEAGRSASASFKDSKVEAYERYWYKVAAEAATGDLGALSRRIEVFVPGAFNRAPVEISTASLGNVFPSRYKWYLKNPLGSAVVVNNVNVPFQNVKVSFRLKDFMDFATETVIDSIEPRQKVEVPLAATLNNRILDVTEDTPIQAELSVTYFEKGKEQTVSRALPLKVHARNAITWEDPRRIAGFITQNDPPVLDLGRQFLLLEHSLPPGAEHLNRNLLTAIRLWSGLGAAGVRFLPSPNNPFEKMAEDPAFPVDYTQFPRETLRRKSGECDDLATLMASLLEGAGVRAVLLDYPGHMALAFDTGTNDPSEAGLPAEELIEHAGSLWVALEPTMVGSPFQEAARKALFAWREMSKDGKAAIIDPREAWSSYEPATLPAAEPRPEAVEASDVERRVGAAASAYAKQRQEFLAGRYAAMLAEDPGNAELVNRLGLLHAEGGRLAEAEKEFQRALKLAAEDAAALNNLGGLYYLQGKHDKAVEHLERAAKADPYDAGIWMNLVRAAAAAGDKAKAREFGAKATALDGELESDVKTLLE